MTPKMRLTPVNGGRFELVDAWTSQGRIGIYGSREEAAEAAVMFLEGQGFEADTEAFNKVLLRAGFTLDEIYVACELN